MGKHQASIRRYANGTFDRTIGPPPLSSFIQGIHDTRYQRYSALDDDGICLVGERLNDQSIIINREVPIESPDVVYSSARERSQSGGADVHNSRIARKIQVPGVLAW